MAAAAPRGTVSNVLLLVRPLADDGREAGAAADGVDSFNGIPLLVFQKTDFSST